MGTRKITIDGDRVICKEICPDNPDGSAATREWNAHISQAEKHLATWNDQTKSPTASDPNYTPGKPSAGDISAMNDAIADYQKEQRKLGFPQGK